MSNKCVICSENKCLFPAYDKNEVDSLLEGKGSAADVLSLKNACLNALAKTVQYFNDKKHGDTITVQLPENNRCILFAIKNNDTESEEDYVCFYIIDTINKDMIGIYNDLLKSWTFFSDINSTVGVPILKNTSNENTVYFSYDLDLDDINSNHEIDILLKGAGTTTSARIEAETYYTNHLSDIKVCILPLAGN